MNVLVFDVDGTLTRTNRVDGQAFSSAVRAVLPLRPEVNWSEFTEFTATAILRELCARYSTKDYGVVEADVERHFFASLESAIASDPEECLPIHGAREIFAEVRAAGWTPAIATGSWRRSAELKLSTAGISTSGVPLVTSSEHERRVDIIRDAAQLACGGAEPEEVVYVGDGAWDVRASRELGIGFLGRAGPHRAQRLLDLGATAVVPDFTDVKALIALLSEPRSLVPSAVSGGYTLAERDPTQINRDHWDELAPVHWGSYGIPEILAGHDPLYPGEADEVGDVAGKDLLHLQCHIGSDTLGWVRRGARVTGVDLSPASLELARKLFAEAGQSGTFIESDVLRLEDDPVGCFDIVYASRGVLCWIGDIRAWARVVAMHLKPGGVFYIMDSHPVLDLYMGPEPSIDDLSGSYFGEGVTIYPAGGGDYSGSGFVGETDSAEWIWSLSDVINALIGAGLHLDWVKEEDRCFYKALPEMVREGDYWWVLPNHRARVPLIFKIRATKAVSV